MTIAIQPGMRQINLAAIEGVLRDRTLGAGRYYDNDASRPDAVGALALAAGASIATLLHIDAYSRGVHWSPIYAQADFNSDCNLLDNVLRAGYDLLPWDRAALCVANDATAREAYRWVAVTAAVKARNHMLARGLDPDVDAPAYRHAGSPQAAPQYPIAREVADAAGRALMRRR